MKCRVIKIIIFSSECCASSIRENPRGEEGLGIIGEETMKSVFYHHFISICGIK